MKQTIQNIFILFQKTAKIKSFGLLFFVYVLFGLNNTFADTNFEIKFIENKGQWDSEVLFKADIPNGHLFISKNCLTYYLIDKKAVHDHQHGQQVFSGNAQVVKVFFDGSNPKDLEIETHQTFGEKFNFFVGNQSTWRSGVRAYRQVILKNIYKGIDLEINSNGFSAKSNFIVKPFADPTQIKLRYVGADSLNIKNEDLVVSTWVGNILEKKPESFQRLKTSATKIYSAYQLNNNILTFRIGEYEKERELIIDPTLIFGTYVGAVSDNFGFCSAFDRNGNTFAGGTVYGAVFPRTTGRFQASFGGGNGSGGEFARDCIITKFSPDGTDMLWATFLGGSNNEEPHSMIGDSSGSLVIMGSTYSSNFPVSSAGYDRTFNGLSDIFVSKLSSDGTVLLGSTFLGGANRDGITGIEQSGYPTNNGVLCYNYSDWYRGEVIVDRFNNIYISSVTSSANVDLLPLPNALQPTYGGGVIDGLIAKFNSSLTNLNFCTYVGGSGDDACYAIIVDALNNLYVTGGTTSSNLPNTTSAFPYHGGVDGFILKTNSSGTVTPTTIYIGTSSYDQSYLIQENENGDIYVIGQTTGAISITPGVYGVANAKQFVKGFNRALTTEIVSTTFGKSATYPSLSPTAFVIDKCNRLYFSGWGGNTNAYNNPNVDNTLGLPTTTNAFQRTSDGSDFYLMILGDGLKELTYASFYGGSSSAEHVDGGTSHFDQNFTIYQTVCAGCWGNNDFPTTPNAWSNTNPSRNGFGGAGCNIGVFKFNLDASIYPPEFRDTILYVNAGDTLNFIANIFDKDNDSILVSASGLILQSGANPATFNMENRSKGLTQARLIWPTLCKDLLTDTFYVNLNLLDNACPISKTGSGKIKIVVLSPPILPPFPECLSSLTPSSVGVKWAAYTQKPNTFGYLKLMKSTNNSPFELIDTIANWQTNERLDLNAFNHRIIQTRYVLVGVNNCGFIGDSSRIINSIYEGDTIVNPGFLNANDSIIEFTQTDTLNATFTISDTDNKDSVFAELSGSLLEFKDLAIVKINDLGSATVTFRMTTDCNTKIASYVLYIKVRDNQCPQPREKTKVVRINILPIKNLPLPILQCPLKINNKTVKVVIPEVVTNKYFKKFKLIRYNSNNFPTTLGEYTSWNFEDSFMDSLALDNSKINYCYQLASTDICDKPADSSNRICIRMTDAIYPDKLTWNTVTVKNDQEVKLVWNKSNNDDKHFLNYNIYKMQDRNGNGFTYLNTVNSINDTTFTDTDVKVDDHSYCYKITNSNECGLESINNDSACSILLKGVSEKIVHTLTWQDYNYWTMGTQKFELLEANEYNRNFVNILPNNNKQMAFQDKIFDYQVGLYYYQIVAHQNPNIGNAISESNTIELMQAPYVYAPNAYTANGDNLNDVWKVEHAFVKEFNLKIYNRWGQLLFETNDKNKPFSLNLTNQLIANDVYVYIINYSGWTGEGNTLKGNFTVLK